MCVELLDLTETQGFENARVKREKAAVENDLLKTQVKRKQTSKIHDYFTDQNINLLNIFVNFFFSNQASLKESQEQAKNIDKLTKENAIMTNM